MENGWVKLHRKLLKSAFYGRSQYVHLWVHLLLKANHEPAKFMWNNEVIVVKEGSFVTGRKALSTDTGIPQTTVEDILNFLEKDGQIRQQKTTKYRLITIVNWQTYQQSDNRATTERQQSDTNKNNNNVRIYSEATPKVVATPSKVEGTTWEEWLEDTGVTADYEGEDQSGNSVLVFRRGGKVVGEKKLRGEFAKAHPAPSNWGKKAPRTQDKFDYDTWLIQLTKSPKKVERIIALIWRKKGYYFDNYEQWRAQMGKDVKAARELEGYNSEQVLEAIRRCQEEGAKVGYEWKASTVAKKIAEVTV